MARTHAILAAVSIAALSATSADAQIFSINLANHPDANQNPPPYGLRLDDLFLQTAEVGGLASGVGGVTTFSFDPADGGNVLLEVFDIGGNLEINISGTVYGGVDTGSAYGFGEGLYDLDFRYIVDVTEVLGADGGWVADPGSVASQGTITAQGNADVAAGTSWRFYQQLSGSLAPFSFLRDEHRLGGFPSVASLDPFVGRGWVTFDPAGADSSGTQDFIFLAIPTPGSLAVLAGAGLLATRRRR
ncbi:MAG: hypothetical protein AAGB51_11095 [Planctomycetota bacterium]